MFVAGLLTSFHCVAMCGSLVVTYAVKDAEHGGKGWRVITPHAAYQAAKLVSYAFVGLLLGYIGSLLDIGALRGFITAGAGLFMGLLAMQMLDVHPFFRYFSIRMPRRIQRWMFGRKDRSVTVAGTDLGTPVFLGSLAGFMPCGPLQAAQLFAIGLGDPIKGSLAMLMFGLGTMPLMLGFGAVASSLGRVFRERIMKVGAVVILLLGIVMLKRRSSGSSTTSNISSALCSWRSDSNNRATSRRRYRTVTCRRCDSPSRIPDMSRRRSASLLDRSAWSSKDARATCARIAWSSRSSASMRH